MAAALRKAGLADLSDSVLQRALYSSDASLYRVAPAVVAHPRDAGEVAAALAVCRTLGVPVTCRGAGTPTRGEAIGAGAGGALIDRVPIADVLLASAALPLLSAGLIPWVFRGYRRPAPDHVGERRKVPKLKLGITRDVKHRADGCEHFGLLHGINA